MKRIFSIFFIFLFIISISINAYSAAEIVNFSLQSAEAKKNRIVTLEFNCDNSNKLAAGIFEFTLPMINQYWSSKARRPMTVSRSNITKLIII